MQRLYYVHSSEGLDGVIETADAEHRRALIRANNLQDHDDQQAFIRRNYGGIGHEVECAYRLYPCRRGESPPRSPSWSINASVPRDTSCG